MRKLFILITSAFCLAIIVLGVSILDLVLGVNLLGVSESAPAMAVEWRNFTVACGAVLVLAGFGGIILTCALGFGRGRFHL